MVDAPGDREDVLRSLGRLLMAARAEMEWALHDFSRNCVHDDAMAWRSVWRGGARNAARWAADMVCGGTRR